MESKRKNFLTILLIIIIVIIVGVIGYLGFDLINGKIKENEAKSITDEFDKQIPTITEEELNESLEEEANNSGEENASNPNGNTEQGGSAGSAGNSGSYNRGSYYNRSYYTNGVNIDGYWVVGTIRIPATGVRYPIFSQPTKSALERGVGMVYTSNGINQVGNSVLAGHNYRNSLFFSRNKSLVVGNLIFIKDVTGVEMKYAVTNKFTTNSSDTSFYQRDTTGKAEINLSTCTDNGLKTGERLIITARQED